MRLHIANASACEVGTKAKLVLSVTLVVTLKPVGVHAFSCGVVWGEIKIVECVKFACYIVLGVYFKAHRTKCVIKIVAHLRNGVKSTGAFGESSGESVVKVGRNRAFLKLYFLTASFDKLGEMIFCFVYSFTHFRAKLGIKLRKLLKQCSYFTRFSKQGCFYVLKFKLCFCRGNSDFCFRAKF